MSPGKGSPRIHHYFYTNRDRKVKSPHDGDLLMSTSAKGIIHFPLLLLVVLHRHGDV